MKPVYLTLVGLVCLCHTVPAQLIFYTHPAAAGNTLAARKHADSLNDVFKQLLNNYCKNSGFYTTTYGAISYNVSTTTGAVTGLVQSFYNGAGASYPGTVSFSNRSFTAPYSTTQGFGSVATGGSASVSASLTTMQGDAPKPAGIGDHYTEIVGNNTDVQGVLISFSAAVDTVGLYLGDVESRTDGYGVPGYVSLYNGSTLITSATIPTGTVNQSLCNGNGSADFDGCGNDETVWVQYYATTTSNRITDILIVAGDADSAGNAGTCHSSFGGLTVGGTCTGGVFLPLSVTDFHADHLGWYVAVQWTTVSEPEHCRFILEKSVDGILYFPVFQTEGLGSRQDINHYDYDDEAVSHRRLYYRLHQQYGSADIVYMLPSPVMGSEDGGLSVYPNPASGHDVTVIMPPETIHTDKELMLTDILGRVVWQASSIHETLMVIPITSLPGPGVYCLFFRCGSRFIRQTLQVR